MNFEVLVRLDSFRLLTLGNILEHTSFAVVFALLALYSLATVTMSFLFSVFFSKVGDDSLVMTRW
jgi:hypothetical protein